MNKLNHVINERETEGAGWMRAFLCRLMIFACFVFAEWWLVDREELTTAWVLSALMTAMVIGMDRRLLKAFPFDNKNSGHVEKQYRWIPSMAFLLFCVAVWCVLYTIFDLTSPTRYGGVFASAVFFVIGLGSIQRFLIKAKTKQG